MNASRTLLAFVVLLLAFGELALGNGKTGRQVEYTGFASDAEVEVELDCTLEEVLFRLNSVDGKYKVLRIRIRNHGSSDLMLSAENDALEVVLETEETVGGILDLGAHDTALWDGLDADLRSSLAYPARVERGEEQDVFVFLPAASVDRLPQVFLYSIQSLPEAPIPMVDRAAAAE